MTTVAVKKINESFVQIISDDPDTYRELSEMFSFQPKGFQHQPMFKAGQWDGFIRLFNMRTKVLPQGLVPKLVKWAKSEGMTVLNDGLYVPDPSIDIEVADYLTKLNPVSKGQPLEYRDYQKDAIFNIIRNQKWLGLSPTSSGKSLILYSSIRFIQDTHEDTGKILLLVPNKGLVEQMYSDFMDYSSTSEWTVEDNCQRISGDYDSTLVAPIVISTWQSMLKHVKNNPNYFNQFTAIFVDEAHLAKGKSISSILEAANKVRYKVGVTGTLSGAYVDEMVLTGLLSEPYTVTTTRELMDAGQVADLSIKMFQLDYSEEIRKDFRRLNPKGTVKYQDEVDFICTFGKRNTFISKMVKALKGNTLILVNRVETHGKLLFDQIQKELAGTGRNVYYIDGSVAAKVREQIRTKLETEVDSVTVATYQTMSTGVSVKNLNNIFFASPSKSVVRVLQSIGRGLRMSATKTACTLYDLADNLSGKTKKNHTMDHATERALLFAEQQFNYKIFRIPIE